MRSCSKCIAVMFITYICQGPNREQIVQSTYNNLRFNYGTIFTDMDRVYGKPQRIVQYPRSPHYL